MSDIIERVKIRALAAVETEYGRTIWMWSRDARREACEDAVLDAAAAEGVPSDFEVIRAARTAVLAEMECSPRG